MSFEQALAARLLADARLDAFGTRIEWEELTQGIARPALLLNLVTDFRPRTYRGFQKMRPTRVQVRVSAETQAQAVSLRGEVITALSEPYSSGDTRFLAAQEISVLPPPERSEADDYWSQIIDMVLWHNA